MTTPQFVDISAFQGSNIDWTKYRQWSSQWDGISRVAMRSSYGVGFVDANFLINRQGALAAGIDQIIYYHYSYPQYNTAIDEANWQRHAVGDIRSQDQIILDIEENVSQANGSWAYQWLAQQQSNYGGKVPGIYSYPSFIAQKLQDGRLSAFPLWYADWQYTPNERPVCPAPWTSYEALQYTDRATNIPGIAGTVDADIFLSSLGDNVNNTVYGPNSADFSNWFTVDGNGNFVCKVNSAVIIGGNRDLFSHLSIDGATLPITGLPLQNEQYHTESDGYSWSSQEFERATIHFDPAHRFDNQPGLGDCYLAHVNPPQIQTVEKVPDALKQDIAALPTFFNGIASAWPPIVAKLMNDAGLPSQ